MQSVTNLPTNPAPMGSGAPHLPQYPTKTDLLEKYWLDFLKFQQAEIRKRLKSGFGVPKVDVDENTFWSWFLENRLEDGE